MVSTFCNVTNPLSPPILFICDNSGSSFDCSSTISIIRGMLIVIPSNWIVERLRLPKPSTPVHTVAPATLFCIRNSSNDLYKRFPLNPHFSLFLLLDTTSSFACRIVHLTTTKEVRVLPRIRAPKESPTFVNIFIANIKNCLFSNRLLDSSANEDIVVNEPQKPTAKRSEYFASRFHITDMTEKIPNARLPTTLTIMMLIGSNPMRLGKKLSCISERHPLVHQLLTIETQFLLFFSHLSYQSLMIGIISIHKKRFRDCDFTLG